MTTELENAGVQPWLAEAVERLVRGDSSTLEAVLVAVGEPRAINETQTRCRLHFLARDGNGFPRTEALAAMLAKQVIDYCIPRSRVNEAVEHFHRTGSTELIVRLGKEATELFVEAGTSGEGGELLLYLLLERVLGVPQLICKMSVKTSAEMHVHGSDGIHGKVLPDGTLALYWGEAKLYGDLGAAVRRCFEGVAPYLSDHTGQRRKRDVLLLRDNLDVGDPDLTEALRRFFVEETRESARVEFRAACLVGFDRKEYPNPDDLDVVAELTEVIAEQVASRVTDHRLASFEIEVFCLPFPSVQDFRDSVQRSLQG